MRKRKGKAPTFTNAVLNRLDALRCARAGASTREIAQQWPLIWRLDKEAKLMQHYDYEYEDGRKETKLRMMGVDEFVKLMMERGQG